MLYKHLNVLSEGPLMIARCPAVEKKDGYYVAPKWSNVLKAMTKVMQSHGLKKKDLYGLETDCIPGSDTYQTYERVYASIGDEDPRLPGFWLYDWDDQSQEFKLLRPATR